MRAHRRRWRLWRAFGVAGAPRCCPEPLRQPNQCLPPHPSSFVFSGFEGAKRQRLCRPSGNPLGLNPAGVLPFRMRAHRRRWRLWRAFGVAGGPRCCPEPLRQPNQCLPPHPSSFVFSGFEGAKRQRLCRPSGNPLGLNPAGVLPFRMRAHRRRWRLWRAFGVAGGPRCCPEPLRQPNQCLPPHPSSFVFSGFEGAKRQRLCRPSGNPLGMNPAGVLLFRMRAHRRRWRLRRAFGVAGAPRCCPEPLRQPNQCLPPHPSSFVFSGFEGAKRQRLCRPSGNPLGLNPAGVLPFRMRAHLASKFYTTVSPASFYGSPWFTHFWSTCFNPRKTMASNKFNDNRKTMHVKVQIFTYSCSYDLHLGDHNVSPNPDPNKYFSCFESESLRGFARSFTNMMDTWQTTAHCWGRRHGR